jgi:hypothetical protein
VACPACKVLLGGGAVPTGLAPNDDFSLDYAVCANAS